MMIIGVDFHLEFQQIAFVDGATGEIGEQRLRHREEAERFYRALAMAGQQVRVGMEASGHGRWFERFAERVATGVVDRRCGRHPEEASPQAEDRSPRRPVNSEAAAERRLSADLGTHLGEPGSTATAVAPSPHGAGPQPDHESVASRGTEEFHSQPGNG